MNFADSFQFEAILKSEKARKHVSEVYGALAVSFLVAGGGAYLGLLMPASGISGLIPISISVGLLFSLAFYPHIPGDPVRDLVRKCLFSTFSLFYGVGLGPFISVLNTIDPSIVPTALFLTALVFVSFSASAIYTRRRSFMFLGGILGTGCLALLALSIMNIFFRSNFLFQVELYLGLVIFCGYVLFDSQLLIERSEKGSSDVVSDALGLFFDAIAIFVRIATILAQNSKEREKTTHKKQRSN